MSSGSVVALYREEAVAPLAHGLAVGTDAVADPRNSLSVSERDNLDSIVRPPRPSVKSRRGAALHETLHSAHAPHPPQDRRLESPVPGFTGLDPCSRGPRANGEFADSLNVADIHTTRWSSASRPRRDGNRVTGRASAASTAASAAEDVLHAGKCWPSSSTAKVTSLDGTTIRQVGNIHK